MIAVTALVRAISSCYCLILYTLLLNRLDMHLDMDLEWQKRKQPEIQMTLWNFMNCILHYGMLSVSGGAHDSSCPVAQRCVSNGWSDWRWHCSQSSPPLNPPSNQYLSSSLSSRPQGEPGWTQHLYQRPPRCLSLGRTTWDRGSVIIITYSIL